MSRINRTVDVTWSTVFGKTCQSGRADGLYPKSAIDRSDGFSSLRVTSPGRTLPVTDIEVEFG